MTASCKPVTLEAKRKMHPFIVHEKITNVGGAWLTSGIEADN